MSSPRDARDEGWDEALLVWNGVEARIPAPPRRAFPPAERVSARAPGLDSPTLDALTEHPSLNKTADATSGAARRVVHFSLTDPGAALGAQHQAGSGRKPRLPRTTRARHDSR